MFRTLHRMKRKICREDLELTDAMNAYWAHFAQKGDPNGPEVSYGLEAVSGAEAVYGAEAVSGSDSAHGAEGEEEGLGDLPFWKAFSSQAPFAMELGDRIGMMEGEPPIQ